MGMWDTCLKSMAMECPQDLISFLLEGARVIGSKPVKEEFHTREMRVDVLIEVEYKGRVILVHIEFQATADGKMSQRLLGYSFEAWRKYELPIYSCVIYLQEVGSVPDSPLVWEIADGEKILIFHFLSLKLAEMSVEQLRGLGSHGLMPLFILAKDGARPEVLDEVMTTLYAENKAELLEVTRRLTGLVFKEQAGEDWFVRRMAMLDHEYMYKNSWTYRETVDRGIDEGLELGKQKLLETERRMVLAFVQARFPQAASLAQSVLEQIDDSEVLQEIAIKLYSLQELEVVEVYLLGLKQGRGIA